MGKLLRGCNHLYGEGLGWGKACLLAASILPVAVMAEPVTIAALGDSLTQGYGLPQAKGFVPQLQDWLREHGAEVTIINAGVSGDTTAGGLARAEWTLTSDIDGVLITLGGNDLLRGIDPDLSRENLREIIEIAQERDVAVTLAGMRALDNFGAEFKSRFDAIYPELAAEYGVRLIGGFLDGLGAAGPGEARDLLQADGIHPNARGVEKIVAAIGPQILPMIEELGGCAASCTGAAMPAGN